MNEVNAQNTSNQTTMNQETKPLFGSPYLIGKVNRDGFMKKNYKTWFEDYYKNYEVNTEALMPLKEKMNDIQIKVFMGTWCPDSQREVPRFYKILDNLQLNESQLTVISMDKYKETPEEYEVGMNIQRVPTFIFYRGQEEIGRIIESPEKSLEKDMVKIVE